MEDIQAIKQRFEIIGNNPGLNRAIDIATQVAPTDLSVLITGESGVGKEIFPRIIHAYSTRKHAQYIAVNCGAIPEGTIDSELFGHEKGAFTGAIGERKGYFGEADGGTIFLDEVGELPLPTQARLLRVLESGEFIKVGSSKVQKTDVRIVAATNVNLTEAIAEGRFREDLYYRLAELEIVQPPLKDCKDDILPLAEFFRKEHSGRIRVKNEGFTEEAKACMLGYDWPGNVRELNAKIKRAVIVADNALLDVCDLGLDNVDCSDNPDIRIIQEKERIRNLLDKNHGNVSKTAAELGCSRTALYKKMKKLDLK